MLIRYDESIPEGKRGKGVTIAYLDSGISNHPDLAGKVIAFSDFVYGKSQPYDDIGHGTHVCGIACGTGRMSNGIYSGIAPEADIVMAKVLDHHGEGNSYNIVKGIDWVLSIKERIPIQILNISIGMKPDLANMNESKMIEAVEKAWDAGIVVVCATGNNGPAPMTLTPMSMSRKVISVGCHDRGFFGKSGYCCEEFSRRGPSRFDIKKPDIVAPGTEIMSCNYKYLRYNKKYPSYIRKIGTSMSTPFISGAAALLLSSNVTMDNDSVKRRILYTADDIRELWSKQGWGMLNIENLLHKSY